MIKKHSQFRKVVELEFDQKTKFSKHTNHNCEAKGGKECSYSYVMFGSICPFCHEQVIMVE